MKWGVTTRIKSSSYTCILLDFHTVTVQNLNIYNNDALPPPASYLEIFFTSLYKK